MTKGNGQTLQCSKFGIDLHECNQHILIAGTTGSGKSVLLNSIIHSFLGIGQELFFLLDPKKVELYRYKDTYDCMGYADTDEKALASLYVALNEIERRLTYMQHQGLKTYDSGYLFIIIDELADLLLSPLGKKIKTVLQRILQIGRATKTFVIACTQIPARKVLDAGLMLNFGVRIALRCNDKIESRQIIGTDDACNINQYGVCIVKGLYKDLTYYNQEFGMLSESELNERAELVQCSKKELAQRKKWMRLDAIKCL